MSTSNILPLHSIYGPLLLLFLLVVLLLGLCYALKPIPQTGAWSAQSASSVGSVIPMINVSTEIERVDKTDTMGHFYIIPLGIDVFVISLLPTAEKLFQDLLSHPSQSNIAGFDIKMDTHNSDKYADVMAFRLSSGIMLWRPGKTNSVLLKLKGIFDTDSLKDIPATARQVLTSSDYKKVGASIQGQCLSFRTISSRFDTYLQLMSNWSPKHSV